MCLQVVADAVAGAGTGNFGPIALFGHKKAWRRGTDGRERKEGSCASLLLLLLLFWLCCVELIERVNMSSRKTKYFNLPQESRRELAKG